MSCRLLLIAAFSVTFANSAFANWWIVRSSDGECLIVDIEPTGSGVWQSDCKVLFPSVRQNSFCEDLESMKPWCLALKHVSPVCSERHVKPNCCQTAP